VIVSSEVRGSVREALTAFSAAQAMMVDHFAVATTDEIVSAVLSGDRPRAGELGGGATYFVHGIGYTVTLPPERLVHIDASDRGDSFSVYDVQQYLEDAGTGPTPDLAEITEALNSFVAKGLIGILKDAHYLL
jgi:hypothetical protein